MNKKILIMLALAAWLPLTATADEQPASSYRVFLYEEFEAGFVPRLAYFFVKSPDCEVRRVQALLAPARSSTVRSFGRPAQSDADKKGQRWAAGVELTFENSLAKESTSLAYSLYVTGPKDRFIFIPPHELSSHELPLAELNSEDLRQRLLEKKGVLKSWELQLEDQKKALQRLKADADVIAGLGRIVDVKEDIQRQTAEVRDLEKDITNLEKFLTMVRDVRPPRNFAGRESQLTRQTAELAEAARDAESTEHRRKALSEQDLQSRLAVIEASRAENFDELQRRLIRLRKHRMELERS